MRRRIEDVLQSSRTELQLLSLKLYHGGAKQWKSYSESPRKGIEEAIILPEINADHFEIKTNLLQLVQASPFHEGAAKVWYEKEPPNSILTWEDLVTKFVNQFSPHSKTKLNLKNENFLCFTQKFEETFSEAWERFKEMLRLSSPGCTEQLTDEICDMQMMLKILLKWLPLMKNLFGETEGFVDPKSYQGKL
ncbi:reverse transcriptase domain-containing protein [Tanacetum coccineum]